jgi:16S rRNA (adenine1518-N6/adenine1519-N6)-dimethyltransferase
VRAVLDRYGITPRKRLGQNFLHDVRVASRIVDVLAPAAGEAVLEIGPGLGALTRPLLERGARVTAIEVDPRIVACLHEEFAGAEGLRIVHADVRDADLAALAGGGSALIANVPYSITGPVISRLIEEAHLFPRAVIMVQKEVATRLMAGAGGREIGAPAVMLRLLYDVRRAFDVRGGAFLPPPEVVSTVLRLRRVRPELPHASLRDMVNRAYRQRRKMVRKTLAGPALPEAILEAALREAGAPVGARPEDLEPEQWIRLCAYVDPEGTR